MCRQHPNKILYLIAILLYHKYREIRWETYKSLFFNIVFDFFLISLIQYSCLENPMDGETWVAAVHGVAQSRTRLK